MSTVNFSNGHYMTKYSKPLTAAIDKARTDGKMVGEDLHDMYDTSINFDYVVRFLMAKYPDFIPVPGTDRNAGLLYADDMGLSVELVAYTDTFYWPVIAASHCVWPNWEYSGRTVAPGWDSGYDPYAKDSWRTCRKYINTDEDANNGDVGRKLAGFYNRDSPLRRGQWWLDELLTTPSTNSRGAVVCRPIDIRQNIQDGDHLGQMHDSFQPKNDWRGEVDYQPGRMAHAWTANSTAGGYNTSDGVNKSRNSYVSTSVCSVSIGPVHCGFWVGYEDQKHYQVAPRYLYRGDLVNWVYNDAVLGRGIFIQVPGLTLYDYKDTEIPTVNSDKLAWVPESVAKSINATFGNNYFALNGIGWTTTPAIHRTKWVPVSTPKAEYTPLERAKKLVLDRVVFSAQHTGTATSMGKYLVEIDGEQYALPATYDKTEDEPKVYYNISYNVRSKESKSSVLSDNFTPTPDITTTMKALPDVGARLDDSPEIILASIAAYLDGLYGGGATPAEDARKAVRAWLNVEGVGAVLKISTQGNTDNFTVYGTYRDSQGLKGTTIWPKESPFVGYITVTLGEVRT